MLRISVTEVMLPTFTTWGQLIRKSRTQLNRVRENKTKELIVDFRRQQRAHTLHHIDGGTVKRVKSFKF
ncbi:hypothetical protein QU886_27845, partial [Klebsiella pneumoniae]|uniref:hypothetical protein n=1 Tax=Klebsiella pneumoniae TaxID=573 RepID=UPI0038BC86D9